MTKVSKMESDSLRLTFHARDRRWGPTGSSSVAVTERMRSSGCALCKKYRVLVLKLTRARPQRRVNFRTDSCLHAMCQKDNQTVYARCTLRHYKLKETYCEDTRFHC
jgi:hypothetical protein